jgi:OmpA-OmpF porin, OOP family
MHKETRMEKRLLAVLIAALAGSAYGQTVTNGASGQPVRGGYGQPVTGAYSQSTAPAAGTQLAQSTNPAPAPRSTANQVAGTTGTQGNPPPAPGYVGSGAGVVATNPFGLCWHIGSDWTPSKAAAPCDAMPRIAAAPVPYVAEAPAPAPAPAPLAAAAPAPTVIEKITLNTDVLFEFNKAELRPSGQQKLDELAAKAKEANVDQLVLTGHADRIGSEQYNQELSEKRAQAVAEYLQSKGVDSSKLQVAGRGESQPITGNECSKLGKDNNKNQKLIACLQPDRRVDAELLGSREQTASTPSAPAATGATSSSGSASGSASGSSSSPSSESGSTTNK